MPRPYNEVFRLAHASPHPTFLASSFLPSTVFLSQAHVSRASRREDWQGKQRLRTGLFGAIIFCAIQDVCLWQADTWGKRGSSTLSHGHQLFPTALLRLCQLPREPGGGEAEGPVCPSSNVSSLRTPFVYPGSPSSLLTVSFSSASIFKSLHTRTSPSLCGRSSLQP